MPGGPLDETLTIRERRDIARARHPEAKPTATPAAAPARRLCRYCFGPLANGVSYWSGECADRLWDITPTVDGEV